jgi:RNA polymerase sigma factor (sigma-70 family)
MRMFKEEVILKGCRDGKRNAQKQLYDRFVSPMLAVCLRYARSRDEAEDLLQEGFLKVFQNINSFRQQGSLEGWIKRIMVNHALNHFKKNRKIPFFEDVTEINEQDIIDTNDDIQVSAPIPPEKLLSLIQTLPEGYRMVFNLYVFEDYTHKDIAVAMNISENTSKTQLMKARRYLQKLLIDFLPQQKTALVDEK